MAREVVTLYTLFIDTHDKNVLMILYKDGKIISKENLETKNKHSEVAMPTIDKLLKDVNVDVSELGNVIVVNGPGSFTGVRIAVTIAKTIAYALSIPIRVIDALTILATGVNTDKKVVAIEDRNGAFVGVFDSNYNTLEPLQYMNKSMYTEFNPNSDEWIPNKEIAEELNKQFSIEVDKRKIVLSDAIKTFGTHTVDVKLHPETTGKLNVLIANKD